MLHHLSNSYNNSGYCFIDENNIFVIRSSQDETGDDWCELWTRNNGTWLFNKEIYREKKIGDGINNRIRQFYQHADCNHTFVMWSRGKYGVETYYDADSELLVYDFEKDIVY